MEMLKVKESEFHLSLLTPLALDIGMIYDWFLEFSLQVKVCFSFLPLPKSSLYLLEQVNIIAYDYEGYGKAPGNPNEQSCYENIEFHVVRLDCMEPLWDFLNEMGEGVVNISSKLEQTFECFLADPTIPVADAFDSC
jgi:hypothetical protein